MTVTTLENSTILLPNPHHKNFTNSGNYIPGGTELEGEFINISGRRRGDNFLYRLFKTNKNNIIYANKVKGNDMNATEVTLGSDSAVTPTRISMPNEAKFTNAHWIGLVVGALSGYYAARKMKKSKKAQMMFGAGGAVVGYAAGKMIAGKPVIDVKLST